MTVFGAVVDATLVAAIERSTSASSSGNGTVNRKTVIPAQAGTHISLIKQAQHGPRVREHDGFLCSGERYLFAAIQRSTFASSSDSGSVPSPSTTWWNAGRLNFGPSAAVARARNCAIFSAPIL
jgi:hypothetical protein